MKANKRTFSPILLIHLAGLLFFAGALSINPLKITRAFFSDEAVYYTMAYSFAYDSDMDSVARIWSAFMRNSQPVPRESS